MTAEERARFVDALGLPADASNEEVYLEYMRRWEETKARDYEKLDVMPLEEPKS